MMAAQVGAHPGDDRRVWRAPQVCSLAGCSYRQLDYWCRLGILRPSIVDAHGQGSSRIYASVDVAAACVLATMAEQGALVSACRMLVAALQSTPLEVWQERVVVSLAGRVELVEIDDLPELASSTALAFWVVNLGACVVDLYERMSNLAA